MVRKILVTLPGTDLIRNGKIVSVDFENVSRTYRIKNGDVVIKARGGWYLVEEEESYLEEIYREKGLNWSGSFKATRI